MQSLLRSSSFNPEGNREPWRGLNRKSPQLQCGDGVEGPELAVASLPRQSPQGHR